ncbi:Uncharacterised protein [Citrobacter amalonaticus]|uniref:Uncharacterized protein n=1 Tax=Citrobacter amalonaticus TaxID=35703 RepID=A0A6N2XIJ6_CITAM
MLLLLPLLPAIESCCTQADNNKHRDQRFDERIALLCIHGGSMTRREVNTRREFRFFGALRKKFTLLQQVASFQEPAPKNQNLGKKNRRAKASVMTG